VAWTIEYHSGELQKGILALPAGLLARYLHLTERMETYGSDLGLPHTRAMCEGLFELRLRAAEGIGRVFYCTLANKRIVMLHQFVKKSEKTPPKELEIAKRRMKEIKDANAQATQGSRAASPKRAR
jgi:phage-related protein